jgi:hypothetical protein
MNSKQVSGGNVPKTSFYLKFLKKRAILKREYISSSRSIYGPLQTMGSFNFCRIMHGVGKTAVHWLLPRLGKVAQARLHRR